MLLLACLTAVAIGRTEAVTAAVTQGAQQAITLCLTLAGIMGLWSGVMELMQESGLCGRIAQRMHFVLAKLFPEAKHDREAMEQIAANVTANLLGLSNAATPIGLRAADRLYALHNRQGEPDEILRFVILNTTSIQLIPTTIAAVRASLGASRPFEILPCVWIASACSAAAGLGAAFLFARMTGGGK